MVPQVNKRFCFSNPLVLGLPHTNLNGFSEVALLMWAGHFQWNSIATLLGRPLSELRTPEGKAIYATFFYVEADYPTGLTTFELDQNLLFLNLVRHFKGMSIDGFTTVYDAKRADADKLRSRFESDPGSVRGQLPLLKMCNVFISRDTGNQFLKLTSPEGCSFDRFEDLPPEENEYPLVREAGRNMTFGLIDQKWKSIDKRPGFAFPYAINADRDTNGAGLVYFAQYVAFMDMAEQAALRNNCTLAWSEKQLHSRTTLRRRIAYFGNVNLDDRLQTEVSLFESPTGRIGLRYIVRRESDQKMIALSEAEKSREE